MNDLDKMCEVLSINMPYEIKEGIISGESRLVLMWNEDGSLRNWGTL